MSLLEEIKKITYDILATTKKYSEYYKGDPRFSDVTPTLEKLNKKFVITKTIEQFVTKELGLFNVADIFNTLVKKANEKKKEKYFEMIEIFASFVSEILIVKHFFYFIENYDSNKEFNKRMISLLLPYISFFRYIITIYIVSTNKNDKLFKMLNEFNPSSVGIKNNKKLMEIAEEATAQKFLNEDKLLFHYNKKNNHDVISLIISDKDVQYKISLLHRADKENLYNVVQVLLNDKEVAEWMKKPLYKYKLKSFPIYYPGRLNQLLKKKVNLNKNQLVYDVINMEDVTIEDYLKNPDNIIIFIISQNKIIKNSAITLTKNELKNSLFNKDFFYQCRDNKTPYLHTIWMPDYPFIVIRRQTINYIAAIYAHKMIESDNQLFALEVGVEPLPYTTSLNSVQIDFTGLDYKGDEVDFISADHCQTGSKKFVADEVFELDVTWKTTSKLKGGQNKKYCRKCKTKH